MSFKVLYYKKNDIIIRKLARVVMGFVFRLYEDK